MKKQLSENLTVSTIQSLIQLLCNLLNVIERRDNLVRKQQQAFLHRLSRNLIKTTLQTGQLRQQQLKQQ